jgi:hypothetical protein
MIFRRHLAIDYFVFIELKLYKHLSKTFTPVSSSQNNVIERDRKLHDDAKRKKNMVFPETAPWFLPCWAAILNAYGCHARAL